MTDVAPELIDTLEAVCGRFSDHDTVGSTPSGGWNPVLWDKLEELGVTLLPIADERGGAGADLPTTAAVLQVLGAHAAAVPAMETALLAGWLIAAGGAEVPPGPLSAVLAPEQLVLETSGRGWRVHGVVHRVPWARHCGTVAVLFPHDHRVALVDPEMATVDPGTNLAGEARDTLHFEDVRLPADRVLALDEHGAVSTDAFLLRAALGKAALMAGAAEAVVRHSIRYAQEREQFGRPIAKFQSVQQHIAQMAGEALAIRVATDSAAAACTDDAVPFTPVAGAKITAGQGATTVAALAHQVHGAIGFTREHPLRLATTRLWAWREEDGNDLRWASRLGERVRRVPPEQLWQRLIPGRNRSDEPEGRAL